MLIAACTRAAAPNECITSDVRSSESPLGVAIVRRDGERARIELGLRGTVRSDWSTRDLVFLSTHEPCPLCLSAALWARVDRVVYAANRDDAARGGFDDSEFYELFARDRSTWDLPVDAVRPPNASAPFDAWLEHEHRTDY